MVAQRATQRVTPAEYLALERHAETRSEYLDGCIVAMSGASRVHNRIALDVVRALDPQLGDGPCEVFALDMRVRNLATNRYTYPDVVAVCGEQEFEDDEVDVLLNPTLIIEVLSPSTEAYDRGDKFAAYRRLPTLQEYLLIAQDRPSVEHYLRQGERWLLTAATDLDATVSLPIIACDLRLRDIYRRVRFAAEPAS
ncbi:MAG: Uma2 family endonuclease [Dehalococcoidia bacterium]